MARPNKTGLSYFQVDIDIYEDDKILLAEQLVDPEGKEPWLRFAVSSIAIRFLREIFKEGYYIEWGERAALIKSSKIGGAMTATVLNKIVLCLVESGFFSQYVFNSFKILTSRGIQERWFFISKNANRKLCDIRGDIKLYDDSIPNGVQKSTQETPAGEQETPAGEQVMPPEPIFSGETPHIIYPISSIKGIGNKGNNNIVSNNNKKKEKRKKAGEQETPAGEQETPAGEQETPAGEQETPAGEQETPAGEQETPAGEQETPAGEQETLRFIKTNWKEKGKIKFGVTDNQMLSGMSDDFKDAWLDWLNYLSFEHHKELKTVFVRQPALEKLVALAGMDEIVAIKIIRESISRGWKQFYKLKEENQNGKQNSNNNGKGHQPFDIKSAISKIDQLLGPNER